MRSRLALAAALFAGIATAAPSHAAIWLPYCTARLANADAGASGGCHTEGPPPLGCYPCGVRRTVDITVATGGLDATLTCDGYVYGPVHVDTVAYGGTGRGQIAIWGGQSCDVRLVATVNGTTASAVSYYSYVFAETNAGS